MGYFTINSSSCFPLWSGKKIAASIFLLCIIIMLVQLYQTRFKIHGDDSKYPELSEAINTIIIRTSAVKSKSDLFDNPSIEPDDKRLLQYIRQHYLTPPPPPPAEDIYSRNYETSEWGPQLRAIFKEIKNGFYVECGANDGEYLSNTNYLEKNFNWTGLLIEANRFLLPDLHLKGRNAWISDSCLSVMPYPQKVQFLHRVGSRKWYKGNGRIMPESDAPTAAPGKAQELKDYVDAGKVECFPLFSLLTALNVTTVDYFSLDVEGVEYKVLKNLPFDKLTIKVISVEFDVTPEGKSGLLELLTGNGYELLVETYRELFMVLTKYKHEFGNQK